MGFLAERYKGKVEAYEIWNEENLPRFWSTGPDPARYVELLKAAHAAIKQSDPAAKVVFGGLSTNDYEFLERAYDSGAKGHFDVMSVHPYNCDERPEAATRRPDGRMSLGSFSAYREVRDSMLAREDDKPIWFTEFGWSTTTARCGVSEATQAEYLTRAYDLVEQDPYVQVALWHNLRNNYWDYDGETIEARYGLLRTDFSPKPAYDALRSDSAGSTDPDPAPAPIEPLPVPAAGSPPENQPWIGAAPTALAQTRASSAIPEPESPFRIGLSRSPKLCPVIEGSITSASPARYRGIARILVRRRVAASRRIAGRAHARGAVLRVAFSTRAVADATRAARRAHGSPILEIAVRGVPQGDGRSRLRRKLALPGSGIQDCR
jgi:glycosyl hydrolase family 39 (putative alpha-L-iduronidase)